MDMKRTVEKRFIQLTILQLKCLYVYHKGCCFPSVAVSYLTLCDPMGCSTPGFPLLHSLLEFAQTHVR